MTDTSLIESLATDLTPDIFQSPAIYKTPDKIREQFETYLTRCISGWTDSKGKEHYPKVPNHAGLCFYLKILPSEWQKLKTHPILGIAIIWLETVLEDEWSQFLPTKNSSGALAYLKAHYPQTYGESVDESRAGMTLAYMLGRAHEQIKLKQNAEQQ